MRREHNSKLIVTMPSGVQTGDNTSGKAYFKEIRSDFIHMLFIIVPTVGRLRINILVTSDGVGKSLFVFL